MKKKLTLLFPFFLLFFFITFKTNGQEILQGGNMESESSWHVITKFHSATIVSDYAFNAKGSLPNGGKGGCLHVTGHLDGGSDMQTNMFIWQPVTLTAGHAYVFTGVNKDLSSTFFQSWLNYAMMSKRPSGDTAYAMQYLYGMDSWDKCGAGVDGPIQSNDICKAKVRYYHLPDSLGTGQHTVYLGIEIGAWTNSSAIDFEFLIDELSLVDSVNAVVGVKQLTISAELLNCTPNPFYQVATLSYSVPEKGNVKLRVYNMLGETVATLVNEPLEKGNYKMKFDGSSLKSGIYFYKLEMNGINVTRKMLLLK